MSNFINIKNLSIRYKIVAIIVSVTIVCISAGFILLAIWNINRVKSQTYANLVLNIHLVSDYCVVPLTFGDKDQATIAMTGFSNISYVETALLYDSNGDIFAKYPDKVIDGEILSYATDKHNSLTDGYYYICEDIYYNSTFYGKICIKANTNKISEFKNNLSIIMPAVLLFLVIVSVVLASQMQKIVSKPIRELKKQFEIVALTQDFTLRTEIPGGDEVGDLYKEFNHLLEQTDKKSRERDSSEKLRRESEKKYKLLVESTPLPISFIDRNNNIVFVNNRFTKVFGYDISDISSLDDWWRIAFPDSEYRSEVIDRWYKYISNGIEFGGKNQNDEILITCKNNDVKEVILSGIVLDDGYLCSFMDVTERNQIRYQIMKLNTELEQRVMERTAQLKDANNELEAFAYSVSHDLRAPLRAIVGFTQILLDDYADKLDDEANRIGGVIQSNTIKMSKLIDDLLDFSRIGRISMNVAPVDMNKLVNIVVNEFKETEIKNSQNFAVDNLFNASADINMMKQVWTNLISNAIKYSSTRAVAEIHISSKKEGNKIIYSIVDNGVGFNMKYKDKLFGVFQRLHSDREFKGTGVGLALVQRIVNRHNGEVWANSEIDKGAEFKFSIPI